VGSQRRPSDSSAGDAGDVFDGPWRRGNMLRGALIYGGYGGVLGGFSCCPKQWPQVAGVA
jgi:hypothetical protein